MRIALFGATDLSLAIAERLETLGFAPAAIVTVGERFSISYARDGISNVRHADLISWAQGRNIPSIVYTSAKETLAWLSDISLDLALAAGWYHMIPRQVRDAFPKGALGLHASTLPKLRGGAPLNWAIISALDETGVSLFELGDGIDDGPLYGQQNFLIGPRDTIRDLVDRAEAAALDLISEIIPAIAEGRAKAIPQQGAASYCLQRKPEDGRIDWNRPAIAIDRLIRAVTYPYPGASTIFDDRKITIWKAEPASVEIFILGLPGQIARIPGLAYPLVVTGDGALVLKQVTDEDSSDVIPELLRASNRRFDAV